MVGVVRRVACGRWCGDWCGAAGSVQAVVWGLVWSAGGGVGIGVECRWWCWARREYRCDVTTGALQKKSEGSRQREKKGRVVK